MLIKLAAGGGLRGERGRGRTHGKKKLMKCQSWESVINCKDSRSSHGEGEVIVFCRGGGGEKRCD